MQLDATSFVLELVNFAVLVWILHRFLYRPVLAAIDRRRSAIEQSLREATAAKEQADKLRLEYEGRFAGWEHERAQARAALATELAAQRAKGLAEAARAAEQERARLAAVEAKHAAELKRAAEEQALALAAGFGARLLERLAGPELDARLAQVFAADLAALDPGRRAALAEAARAPGARVVVQSARPLAAQVRAALTAALCDVLGAACAPEFALDAALIAGVRVALGPWLLEADLGDELRYFVEGATHAA